MPDSSCAMAVFSGPKCTGRGASLHLPSGHRPNFVACDQISKKDASFSFASIPLREGSVYFFSCVNYVTKYHNRLSVKSMKLWVSKAQGQYNWQLWMDDTHDRRQTMPSPNNYGTLCNCCPVHICEWSSPLAAHAPSATSRLHRDLSQPPPCRGLPSPKLRALSGTGRRCVLVARVLVKKNGQQHQGTVRLHPSVFLLE